MKQNSKLSLALHALGHMAVEPDRPMTSAEMSRFGTTNPVVVRRVLGLLRRAGLVSSEKGHAGGWRLARDPRAITVADVYLALGDRFMAPMIEGPENPPHCAIERALHGAVDSALAEAEAGLVDRLGGHTIADLAGALTAPV